MKTSVLMLSGDFKYLSLPKPAWIGREKTGTGYYIYALYRSPITQRYYASVITQWQGNRSGVEEICESDYLRYCELAGIESNISAQEA
jgi:hypothetical protein